MKRYRKDLQEHSFTAILKDRHNSRDYLCMRIVPILLYVFTKRVIAHCLQAHDDSRTIGGITAELD